MLRCPCHCIHLINYDTSDAFKVKQQWCSGPGSNLCYIITRRGLESGVVSKRKESSMIHETLSTVIIVILVIDSKN